MSDEIDALLNEQSGALERIVPSAGIHDKSLEAEHVARYKWAADRLKVAGLVLDIASGVGYGKLILCEDSARVVISSDIAASALVYGKGNFGTIGVAADGIRLPFKDAVFDAIVSIETIEHVPEPARLLRELHRVLKPAGSLLVSTPNGSETSGDNPHHLKEFARDEFLALLSESGFLVRRRHAQHLRPNGGAWRIRGLRRAAWSVSRRSTVFPDVWRFATPLVFCWECAPVTPTRAAPPSK